MNFTGKNVIITGGAGAIGFTMAQEFLNRGVEAVGIMDISDPKNVVETLAGKFPNKSVIFLKADVRKREDIAKCFAEFIQQFKFVDIVIGGAGIANEMTPEDTILINLLGVINTSHEAMEWMSISKNGRGGIIANISSISGVLFFKHNPVYSATKHGILGFTKCMGSDIIAKMHGIHFITICPGITDTSIITDNIENRFLSELLPSRCTWLAEKPHQTPEQLALHIADVLAFNKNGSIWVIEDAKYIEYTPADYKI